MDIFVIENVIIHASYHITHVTCMPHHSTISTVLGKCVYDQEVETKSIKNEPTPMNLDLSKHLQDDKKGVGKCVNV